MQCKDNSLDYLNSLGYNVVRLPREGIEPLLVVGKQQKKATVFGPIKDLIQQPTPELPTINKNLQTANISGLKSSKLEFGIGIKFLQVLLSALGAGSAAIDLAYKKAKTIEFEYENVLLDSIFTSSAVKFLTNAKPDVLSEMAEYFDEQGEAYLIIEVLKSTSFGTRAYDENGKTIDLSIDAIKNIIGIDPKISIARNESLKISYKGSQPLVFGFKACAFWIEVDRGVSKFRLAPFSGAVESLSLRSATLENANFHPVSDDLHDPNSLTPVLLSPNTLLNLH
ncbi:hypothetical protein C7B80_16695 [Cyanosarcina cf. burmensis CCALA 770]|nr:hypothetical protein C7B80_16695 [Cyanosarcina cf. burmensis CCALA 770]